MFDFEFLTNIHHERDFQLFKNLNVIKTIFSIICNNRCCFDKFNEIYLRHYMYNDFNRANRAKR